MYNVKHKILDGFGSVIELTTGPITKAAAEHLLCSLAHAENYRGGTMAPVKRKTK